MSKREYSNSATHPKRKKTILVFINSFHWLYSLRKELVEQLLQSGFDVHIAGDFDGYQESFIEMNCVVHRVAFQRRGTSITADFRTFLSYIALIRSIQPVLVLTFSIKCNIYGCLAARCTGIQRIATVTGLGTGLYENNLLQKLLLFLYRIALGRANCVFLQNNENYSFMEKHRIINKRNNPRLVNGSGVNLSKFSLLPFADSTNICQFLFIGRIMREKGVGELVEAFQRIVEGGAAVALDMVGMDEEGLAQQLQGLGKSLPMRYHGQVKDVHSFIAASHCTVLPSYHEGMANVLLESAACGRPIIASNISGCRETFDEGISGFACRPRDATSLKNAMEHFLSLTHQQRMQMGLAGRKKMEKEFDRNQVIKAYMEEINSIVRME